MNDYESEESSPVLGTVGVVLLPKVEGRPDPATPGRGLFPNNGFLGLERLNKLPPLFSVVVDGVDKEEVDTEDGVTVDGDDGWPLDEATPDNDESPSPLLSPPSLSLSSSSESPSLLIILLFGTTVLSVTPPFSL